MRIEVLDGAEQDLLEGCRFYEEQAEGVGRYFFDSILADIESLHLYAGVHAKHLGFYCMLARRFPFAIFYRMAEGAVRVHAILDCRRDPERIQRRLTRES
jgi:hypothetical protein